MMNVDHARKAAGQVLAKNSKSFALAARLLPPEVARNVVVLYAYCRRADDEVDLAPPSEQSRRLAALRAELDGVFSAAVPEDPALATFQQVVRECEIPRVYLDELLMGMQMDVEQVAYRNVPELALYAHRVAGVVGLMMCHVMGVRDPRALEHAAHLGIAMQLTNIARDVLEDWQRGRLYLPDELLAAHGAPGLRQQLLAAGGDFPEQFAAAAAGATADLLEFADEYYVSGDLGMADLSLRCSLAVRTARSVYAAIGDRVRAQGCNPLAGRAIVPTPTKLRLAARALHQTLYAAPKSWLRPAPRTPDAVWSPERLVIR
jgi:15-cis-phytoene synthase